MPGTLCVHLTSDSSDCHSLDLQLPRRCCRSVSFSSCHFFAAHCYLGIDLDADTLLELAEHPKCCGVKLTCGSISKGYRLSVSTQKPEYQKRHPLPFAGWSLLPLCLCSELSLRTHAQSSPASRTTFWPASSLTTWVSLLALPTFIPKPSSSCGTFASRPKKSLRPRTSQPPRKCSTWSLSQTRTFPGCGLFVSC